VQLLLTFKEKRPTKIKQQQNKTMHKKQQQLTINHSRDLYRLYRNWMSIAVNTH
jgi:hypothetical protein